MIHTYFIRVFDDLEPEHFQPPRYPDTVRRSLDGTLCVLAFDEGTEPEGWADGMSVEQIRELLNSSESEGIWWTPEV